MTALSAFAVLAVLAVSGTVQYTDQSGQVVVLNPESHPYVGSYWTVGLELSDGGTLAVASIDGTYFGEDIGFTRMYDQDGTDMQPSYQDGDTVRFDGITAGSWHFEVAVYTAGRHDMVFELGQSTARASNNALIPKPFITTWQTTSAGETITLPISVNPGSYTVSWGDGDTTTHTQHATHAYASAGNHTVSVSGNDLAIRLDGNINNAAKLVSIDQWGDVRWQSMVRAFYLASNMAYNATDAPDLSAVTDTSFMFGSAPHFDGDLSSWDVSGVRSMRGMFWETHSFNGDISTWDVSGVTDISNMFNGASKFNGDLSAWDVSRVTDMTSTFARATVFDADLSAWDVSRVKSMNGLFKSANAFNADISAWDVSRVTDMGHLFSFAYVFDGDISEWDVSKVTNMAATFNHADSFNGNISAWDVSRVTNMNAMFWENKVFNGDISAWDVSRVADMTQMFALARVFNGDISAWDVSDVRSMYRMFGSAHAFNGDISAWDVSGVRSMYLMFGGASQFNGDISAWDVSRVTDMEDMFHLAYDFEQNLGNWYIVLNSTSINIDDAPGIVGTLSAQNRHLEGHDPSYEIVAGGDADSFEITGDLGLNMTVSPTKSLYTVNITSTGSFGTSNHRIHTITVPIAPTNPAPVASFGDGDEVEGTGKSFDRLNSPYYITTVKIDSGMYALVTSSGGTGGVQIIDITDPANPLPASSFHDDETITVNGIPKTFDKLQGARGIATTTIDSKTYVLIAANGDDGIQIVDITDPANPLPVSSFGDGDAFDKLDGAFDITTAKIGSGTYAIATAYHDNGVQIINITDPANPVPVASFVHGDTVTVNGSERTFGKLKHPEGITTTTIGSDTYALVAAYQSDGVQIINITDPANPVPASSFGDGHTVTVNGVRKTFGELGGANGITTAKIGPDTYALVTAYDDDGVQIINITDPANPVPAASLDNGKTVAGKTIDQLGGAFGIDTIAVGSDMYALVASMDGNGVQIIDITDPTHPVPAASVGRGDSFDGKTFDELTVPRGITTAIINANAYALVASFLSDGIQIIDLGATPDVFAPPPYDSFVTTWQTISADEMITIPVSDAAGTYTVHWGDGNITTHAGDATHTYATAGNHTVSISGDFTRIYLAGDMANAKKIVSLDRWGNVRWESMNGAFYGASNMVYNATDAPDLYDVTDTSFMFSSAPSFDGDLSSWDVFMVTDMSGMFHAASSFDGELSSWDVSGVTDMNSMFEGAASFNRDISVWNVSSVTDMSGMFHAASSFDGELSSWDVSGVTDMNSMFGGAASFNQDISAWNIAAVTDTNSMFDGAASFNSDISAWNVSAVTDMSSMFYSAASFNSDISAWSVSRVTDTSSMFYSAAAFNHDISAWNVSRVTDMSDMFYGAASFNSDISAWNVSEVAYMSGMFNAASAFVQNLGNWYIVLDGDFIYTDDAPGIVGTVSAQNHHLDGQNPTYGIGTGSDADSFEITGGSGLSMTVSPTKLLYTVNITSTGSFGTSNHRIYNITVSNSPTSSQSSGGSFVTTWKTVSAGERITVPVNNAEGIYTVHWGDGNITTHTSDATHTYATAGNHTVSISGDFARIYLADNSTNAEKIVSIDQWGDARWESMNGAFRGASNVTYNATDVPDLSGVLDMSSMFRNAASFDGDLSGWNVSGVSNMHSMFRGAASFDGDLSDWDVSGVDHMYNMFRGTASFDGDLSD